MDVPLPTPSILPHQMQRVPFVLVWHSRGPSASTPVPKCEMMGVFSWTTVYIFSVHLAGLSSVGFNGKCKCMPVNEFSAFADLSTVQTQGKRTSRNPPGWSSCSTFTCFVGEQRQYGFPNGRRN